MVYFALAFSRPLQNLWLLTASLAFYAWGEPIFVFFLVVFIIVNWALGLKIARTVGSAGPLALTVGLNLALLFFSKYLGMIITTLNYLLNMNFPSFYPSAFPLGVSFFTLQAISYAVDIHRREAEPLKSPISLGLYLSFFPLMVAGPVVHFADISGQLAARQSSWSKFSLGSLRLVTGLAKYALLAVPLGHIADRIFGLSSLGVMVTVPALLALMGLVAFAFHLYFFLSGFADMAIGLGLIFGFEFRENFDYPYWATSLTEFWQKWNISVVTWFDKYFFQPLRASRTSPGRAPGRKTYSYGFDLVLVWILFGLWNGPDWTFCLWGPFRALFCCLKTLPRFRKAMSRYLSSGSTWSLFFCSVGRFFGPGICTTP